MSLRFANVISIILHPLLLATYLFAAFVVIDPIIILPPGYNKIAQWLVVLVVWLTTFAIPALSIVMLKFTGNVKSLRLENRKERLVPFFYISMFYGFTAYYFSRQMVVSDVSEGVFILTASMIFIGAIITFFWKISVHSLGMGGSTGFLIVLSVYYPDGLMHYLLVFSVVLSGLVITARLRLDAHTPAQAYAGYLLGLLISFMLLFWI